MFPPTLGHSTLTSNTKEFQQVFVFAAKLFWMFWVDLNIKLSLNSIFEACVSHFWFGLQLFITYHGEMYCVTAYKIWIIIHFKMMKSQYVGRSSKPAWKYFFKQLVSKYCEILMNPSTHLKSLQPSLSHWKHVDYTGLTCYPDLTLRRHRMSKAHRQTDR